MRGGWPPPPARRIRASRPASCPRRRWAARFQGGQQAADGHRAFPATTKSNIQPVQVLRRDAACTPPPRSSRGNTCRNQAGQFAKPGLVRVAAEAHHVRLPGAQCAPQRRNCRRQCDRSKFLPRAAPPRHRRPRSPFPARSRCRKALMRRDAPRSDGGYQQYLHEPPIFRLDDQAYRSASCGSRSGRIRRRRRIDNRGISHSRDARPSKRIFRPKTVAAGYVIGLSRASAAVKIKRFGTGGGASAAAAN